MNGMAHWTWLVYMAGDNNLEGFGRADLAEMKRVGSTDDVNVVVQFDTEESGAARFLVQKDGLRTIEEMPGVDCGDPAVLTRFLKWGMTAFPASHYLLDVWNHGSGWERLPPDYDYDAIRALKPSAARGRHQLRRALFRTTVKKIHKRTANARAIAIDCGSQDYLDNQELREAVSRALPNGRKLDILGCDACLMNMLEVAYEMKDTARFMVGSEETEPVDGWPYAEILDRLVARPSTEPVELARIIVAEYARYYRSREESVTQSALDLGRIATIAAAVDELADSLCRSIDDVAGVVSLARDRAQKFDMPEYVDLGDLASELARRLPHRSDVQAATSKIKAGLALGDPDSFVVESVTWGHKMARATGVSIYLPRQADYAPDYKDLLFSAEHRWKGFLEALVAA
jgi:cysteine peptidase C11 family protein